MLDYCEMKEQEEVLCLVIAEKPLPQALEHFVWEEIRRCCMVLGNVSFF
jgi:hypothetical protein